MTIASRWPCRVCWKSNHPDADRCWQCKAPRDVDEAGAAAHKAEMERRAALPERVPDVVVALPVVIFRSYARVWLRGGLGSLVVPLLLGFAGLTDVSLLLLTGGLAVGLVGCGFLAGEVAEGMAAREAWAFVLGILLAIVGAVGSVMAVDVLAPGLFDPGAVRWGSVIVFGGAGIAAAGGTWRILDGVPHTAQAGPDGAVVVDTFAPIRADWDAFDTIAPVPPQWP